MYPSPVLPTIITTTNVRNIRLIYARLGALAIARCLEINHLSKLKMLILKDIGASSSALNKLLLSFQGIDSVIEVLDLSGNYFCPQRKTKKVCLSLMMSVHR